MATTHTMPTKKNSISLSKLLAIALFLIGCTTPYTHTTFITIANENQYYALMQEKKPLLLQFSSDQCSSCNAVKKPLEEIAQEPEFQTITIARINTNTLKSLATLYQINKIPTFIYFNNGEKINTVIGVKDQQNSRESLRRDIRKNLINKTPKKIKQQKVKAQSPHALKQKTTIDNSLSKTVQQNLQPNNASPKTDQPDTNNLNAHNANNPHKNTQIASNFLVALKSIFGAIASTIASLIQTLKQKLQNLFT